MSFFPLSFSAMLNLDFDSFNETSVSTTLQLGSTAPSQFGLFHFVSFLLVHSFFPVEYAVFELTIKKVLMLSYALHLLLNLGIDHAPELSFLLHPLPF